MTQFEWVVVIQLGVLIFVLVCVFNRVETTQQNIESSIQTAASKIISKLDWIDEKNLASYPQISHLNENLSAIKYNTNFIRGFLDDRTDFGIMNAPLHKGKPLTPLQTATEKKLDRVIALLAQINQSQ